MRIFYAVQATGNGHISRAMELLPSLSKYGSVDLFLSGSNSHLCMDAPVRFRSSGLSLFYNSTGGLDYRKIISGFRPYRLFKEIAELPVEKYDLVINDFEFITAAACARKRIPSIAVGHQASFRSPFSPRPERKNLLGEAVLKYYGYSSCNIGLHFERYDDFILPPVIKNDILTATPVDRDHISVYLPAYPQTTLCKFFRPLKSINFEIFTKEVAMPVNDGHITWMPVEKRSFNRSLVHCHGIICGAGFETPAEALYLGKKLLCIPARGQYEQLCNAAALERMGVRCLSSLDGNFSASFMNWLFNDIPPVVDYGNVIPALVEKLMEQYELLRSAEPINDMQPESLEAACQLS